MVKAFLSPLQTALSQDVSIIKNLGEPERRAQDKGILTLRRDLSVFWLGAQPQETVNLRVTF